jgi:2-haloalkanoic acid dehalogenase type II
MMGAGGGASAIRAVTFDAYGTLLRNEDLKLIPQRIVADHGLSVLADEVLRVWIEGYHEATQVPPFRTLREIQREVLARTLRRFGVEDDAAPYVELFFDVTTRVELYPDALEAIEALGPLPSAIVSNADHEHLAAWRFTLPVRFIVISEAERAYKPDPKLFRSALQRFGMAPDEVLHVGDSELDDVRGATTAGLRTAWLNRERRTLRPGVPRPDFELPDLTALRAVLSGGG